MNLFLLGFWLHVITTSLIRSKRSLEALARFVFRQYRVARGARRRSPKRDLADFIRVLRTQSSRTYGYLYQGLQIGSNTRAM
ncbi:hypothetical protein F5882DRAFT_420737 [Hyaloscypha sp. PMI_1271]|nr:hypothetical protein F5882DRAFT_420737 [Hyaloscypha sp. PMI_1271]